MRPTLDMRVGSYYLGGPPVIEYRVSGVRVPRWVWVMFYNWMKP